MRLHWVVATGTNMSDGFRHGTYNVWSEVSTMSSVGRRDVPSSSGRANDIISSGSTSGTPPTFVETTYSPAQAASTIAIPKDSVRDVFKNIDPSFNSFCALYQPRTRVEMRNIWDFTHVVNVAVFHGAAQNYTVLQQILLAHLE